MIVLDTNVISELVHPSADPRVQRWADDQLPDDLHLTAVTAAELAYALARLPLGRRRDDLGARLEVVLTQVFAGRIVPFDERAAEAYGPLVAGRVSSGRPIGIADAQIASTCLSRGVFLATRDAGFAGLGLTLLNPWEA